MTPDKVASLSSRLIQTEDPDQLSPVAAELRLEIQECVRRIRAKAMRTLLSSTLAGHGANGVRAWQGDR